MLKELLRKTTSVKKKIQNISQIELYKSVLIEKENQLIKKQNI